MRAAYSFIILLIVHTAAAQDINLFKKEQFDGESGSLSYRILYPSRYDVDKKYPVIFFLHGAGERGSDNEQQLVHGASLFLDSANRAKYPAFVIFPQCPANDFWARVQREANQADSLGRFIFVSSGNAGPSLQLVEQLIDSFARTPQADKSRIYIGGLSMGAMGTFELLWRKPHFFAGAFAICGGGDPQKPALYGKNFPIWVFHGDKDNVVPVSNSRLMVNRLRAAGAKVKYTEYPGVAHDSWTNSFAEPGFLPWLFDQQRPAR